MEEYLSPNAALSLIAECRKSNTLILGVDGLEIVGDNIMGRIDLTLDISDKGFSVEYCAILASEFVRENARDNIVFDVVVSSD